MLKVKATQSTFSYFRSPAVSSSYIWRPAVLLLCINVLISMLLRHVHLLNHWATWSHWRQHMRKIKHKRLELWLTSRWKHVEPHREGEGNEGKEWQSGFTSCHVVRIWRPIEKQDPPWRPRLTPRCVQMSTDVYCIFLIDSNEECKIRKAIYENLCQIPANDAKEPQRCLSWVQPGTLWSACLVSVAQQSVNPESSIVLPLRGGRGGGGRSVTKLKQLLCSLASPWKSDGWKQPNSCVHLPEIC